MSIAQTLKLPFTYRGWQELKQRDVSIPALVWLIVVPMSLLPPLVLYFAGTHFDNTYIQGFADKNWRFITTSFFMAELLTFFVMGWLIYSVANLRSLEINYHDAYLLAAIAPLPMWLSALVMLVPVLLLNIAVVGLGALLSCYLVYTGILSLCDRKPGDVVSMSAAYTIMAAAFMAWILLMVILWAY